MTYDDKSRQKLRESMIKKYGSEEAVKEEYRRRQAKSRETYKGTGGFAYLAQNDPEKLSQLSKKGGQSSKRGESNENQ